MKVNGYIDGFNLYYRALKGTKHKWLDLRKMLGHFLDPSDDLATINYYTARVSGKIDSDQPRRQHCYLRAIQACGVTVHQSLFLANPICRPLVHNMPLVYPRTEGHQFVMVHNNQEKGSDVKLASHLIRDAFRSEFDYALVLSADSDLIEPIRIVSKDIGIPVGLVCPFDKTPATLKEAATFHKHLNSAILNASQMPNTVKGQNGKEIHKPAQWR